jgi:hypothetical protein
MSDPDLEVAKAGAAFDSFDAAGVVMPDHKRFYTGDAILRRRSRESESTNHGAVNNEIHFSHRRCRTLSL